MPQQTVAEFKTSMMQEFGLAEDNQNEGTSSEAIIKYINEANETFINHRAWKFRLKPFTQYIYPATTVKTQFNTASVAIKLNLTDNWPNTGRIMVDLNIIEFTANNTGTDILTPVTSDINRTHEVGERVLLLQDVPSDFNKIASLYYNEQLYLPDDQRNGIEPESGKFWTIEVIQEDPAKILIQGRVKKYLVFPYHTTRRKISYWYGKKATDFTVENLDLTEVYVEVPEPYTQYINHIVSARIYKHLEELTLSAEHENKAAAILLKASIFDSKQHFGNKIPIRSEWDDPARVLRYRDRRYLNRH